MPYGDTVVVYEKGGSEIESVDAADALDSVNIEFQDSSDKTLTDEEVCSHLSCTEAELKELYSELAGKTSSAYSAFVEKYVEDNPEDFFPDED